MPQHVAVFSHRRSGTHLTIDAIRNNFGAYAAAYVNLDELDEVDGPSLRDLNDPSHVSHVLKSHCPANVEACFAGRSDLTSVKKLVNDAKTIYVYRDGRDVVTSLFHYVRSVRPELASMSFSTFLHTTDPLDIRPANHSMTVVEYWKHHVSGWLRRSDVLPISFEFVIRDFDAEISRLSTYLGRPLPETSVNVVRSSDRPTEPNSLWSRSSEKLYKMYKRIVSGVDLTSVNFRQGRIGTYEDVFSGDDLAYFYDVAGDLLHRLGYDT